jgi:outer membrane protein TolC
VIRIDIEEALSRARRNSDAIHFAELEYEEQIGRYRTTVRGFFPQITLGYAQDDAVEYYAPDSHLRRISLGVDQLLYAGGSRVHRRRTLAQGLRMHQRTIEQMASDLRLEVVSRYVEILKLKLQIAILEENLKHGRDQVLIAEQELSVGEITRLDYLEIELEVQSLVIDLARLRQEEYRMTSEMKELLGIDPACGLELSGAINADFEGMLTVMQAEQYVDCARANSLEIERRSAEIRALRAALREARNDWLPKVSSRVELSLAGEEFPLSAPGVSMGLNLDFNTPLLPFRSGITGGYGYPEERSLGTSTSAQLAENLEGLRSVRLARIELRKAEAEKDRYERTLEYSVRQEFKTRSYLLDDIRLERRRLDLMTRRQEIQALMLEIGEITRLEYLQSGIELARLRIEQLSRIVSLFLVETTLLSYCGLEGLEGTHSHILTAEQNE